MKSVLQIIGYVLLSFVCLAVLLFVTNSIGLTNYKFFAPKFENARRETFENTQSYVQGKIQDLSNYKFQYEKAKDSADKEAIKSVVRTQFSNFDESKLPYDLKMFLEQMR